MFSGQAQAGKATYVAAPENGSSTLLGGRPPAAEAVHVAFISAGPGSLHE
jgi:hypothetical protein